MSLTVTHNHQTAITNDPTKDVSANAWNDVHALSGTLPVANGGTGTTTATGTAGSVVLSSSPTLTPTANNLVGLTVANTTDGTNKTACLHITPTWTGTEQPAAIQIDVTDSGLVGNVFLQQFNVNGNLRYSTRYNSSAVENFSGAFDMGFLTGTGGRFYIGTNSQTRYIWYTDGSLLSQGWNDNNTLDIGYTIPGTFTDATLAPFGVGATWNTVGTPTLIRANVTDTASAAGALLLDLRKATVSQFHVDKFGITYSLPTVVGSLPAAGTAGRRSFVTDATQTMTAGIGTVVAGTGGNKVPVYDDGTNWRIG